MLDKRKFYIDARWTDPVEAKNLEVINPSTEEAFAIISLGTDKDTDLAVDAAKRAFDGWSNTAPGERLAKVERLLEIYKRRAEEMARTISQEMGAPIDMALRSQVGAGAWHMTNFITAFRDFKFVRPLGDHAPDNRIVMDPIGVVGLITPWNWPMNQVTLKVTPALLAGCTLVLKPSEVAPLSSMLFAEFADEAGIPAGVFNLVNGDGPGVGTRLSAHPDIEMISFTGSTRAGKAISKVAAETLKRVALELGGKGANIIFEDADGDAVRRGAAHCFNNTGQSCNAPTRMLVQRSIYDDAVETAKSVAEALAIDVADKHGAHIGPLVSDTQYSRVQDLIGKGIEEGARLVAGGPGRPSGLNRGYFVRPTIFADVDNNMTIAREEVFGPVLSIIPFDTEEEAITIANDTPYGLSNYVQTQDGERRNRVARKLKSGMVEMNGVSRAAGAPFGGVKASGRAREGGVWGIEEFLEPKAVSGWSEESAISE
ncbi:aldehyde dehydrogenase family protein [Neorhizobium galegae]|uniref:aldehyde dehydrogenase (NAD(+)) n=1 Tax=Neorhizobium galegae bv. orientalis str. HAMBI 540 TaxID=1028800 RepID=A0A068SP85_NEOGA|nr:aldehyde dehydrogenase family protein [Neorhizobium galegae]CDN48112.1 Aldehyde dehydrogenase [Neorhizobium galegae bv. orientalis str. HAMBI 540]